MVPLGLFELLEAMFGFYNWFNTGSSVCLAIFYIKIQSPKSPDHQLDDQYGCHFVVIALRGFRPSKSQE